MKRVENREIKTKIHTLEIKLTKVPRKKDIAPAQGWKRFLGTHRTI
jgi:hypothetical protein